MIRKLQKKYIKITMLSLLAVMFVVLGTVNGINVYQMNRQTSALLAMLVDNGGSFPQQMPRQDEKQERYLPEERKNPGPGTIPEMEQHKNNLWGYWMSEETPFETRYFTVKISEENAGDEEYQVDLTHVAVVAEDAAKEMTESVLAKDRAEGYSGRYKYRIQKMESGDILVVFVDCANDLQYVRNFALVSAVVGFLCMALVLILVSLLSRRAIRPLIENMERQKQFITDAGHEIKTPIAIISANAEVIEMCQGENEWTQSIRNQVVRLNELVRNLLTLSKMDEMQEEISFAEFSWGCAIRETVENFDSIIQAKSQEQTCEIDTNIKLNGNEESIRRMTALLMDNAVKYAPEHGRISIFLGKRDNKIEFSVYNDCAKVPEGDLNRLFDRFYRADSSRSRKTGGYGIGLSVVSAIVRTHKGRITAETQDNGICFRAKFPAQGK